jgi:hypothetical protein
MIREGKCLHPAVSFVIDEDGWEQGVRPEGFKQEIDDESARRQGRGRPRLYPRPEVD